MKFINKVFHLVFKIIRNLMRLTFPTNGYAFTTDYLTHVLDIWDMYFSAFKGRDNLNILEIGSYEGRSAIWFIENLLEGKNSKLTCVDIFFSWLLEARFDHNIKQSGRHGKVIKVKASSQEILPLLEREQYEIIYVDGSHVADHVRSDADQAFRLLKKGGMICFDDYEWRPDLPKEQRPQIAIDEFLQKYQNEISVLHKEYQVIVQKNN